MAAVQTSSSMATLRSRLHSSHAQTRLCEARPSCQPFEVRTSRRIRRTVCMSIETSSGTLSPQLQDQLKRAVSRRVLEQVESGMTVAMGAGSTSCIAIEELGILIKEGKIKDIDLVVTSFQSQIIARQNNIRTVDMNSVDDIDLAIDGADEVDLNRNLIKGGGAGHTLEKVSDSMARDTVIIVDESKIVPKLGVSFPVPVEVLPQAVTPVLRSLLSLGGVPEIRAALMKDGAVITDLGNMIVDVRFPGGVDDPVALERTINNIPGVVENGLFCNIAKKVLVATTDGEKIIVLELAEYVKKVLQ